MNANELKELYLKLKEQEANLDLLEEADSLRNEAKKANNDEYYLRGTVLIMEIFMHGDDNLLDDALKLAIDNYNLARDYSDKFPDIYKDYLSYMAYIYITKQLYKQALQVETERKDFIDPNNKSEVNRWQLELAYIYNAIDEKNEALRKFQAILLNEPDNETKSVCLSDIAQLYIEEHDFENAKKTLEENYRFAKTINDEEGIRYINCLKGKIYHLEGNYKNSYNTLYPLVKDIKELNMENFNYINEFLSLLIDMNRYNEGLNLVDKFYNEVSSSFDLADKLLFYKNALKLEINENIKKKKGALYDSSTLLDEISNLELEIQKNKDIISSKVKESELDLDTFNKERNITSKIKDNLLNIKTTNYRSLREFIFDYSKSLNEVIPMDEVLVVLFDKTLNQDLSIFPLKEELISLFEFKNNRLYERKLNYSELDKTVISEVINDKKALSLDFVKNNYAYINPITKDFYVNEKVKYIMAMPLDAEDTIFGEVIYLSKSNNILDYYNSALLEIECSLFKASLKNMLYLENNNLIHSLFEKITTEQQFGIFYYSDNNKKYILSEGLKDLIKVNKSELSSDSFNDLIVKSDFTKYSLKYDLITRNENYDISYHLLINDSEVLVRERGIAEVINNNLYYVGTITKIDLDRNVVKELNNEVLDLNSLNEELERRRDTKFTALVIKGKFDRDYYSALRNSFKELVYFSNNLYYLLFNEKCANVLASVKVNKDVMKKNYYTVIEYPINLVRLDDLVGVSSFILNNATTLFTTFTNELYASYISVNTIETMVSRAIAEDKVSVLTQSVTLDNQFVGYLVTPSIPGVFDLGNLRVVGNKTIELLDKRMVKLLEGMESISIYSLSLESLESLIDSELLKEDTKIVFNITKYNNKELINKCINALKDTKCRIILDYDLFKSISIDNINSSSDIILAFSKELNDDDKDVVLKYLNDYYIFDSSDSLKVSKVINKK